MIERTSAAKRPFLTVQGMSKCLGSEVECVQSLIMAVKRKETSIGNRVGFDCVYAFLSEVMYTGNRHSLWHILYRCIVGSCTHTHTDTFIVAIYKSSAFALTSHYELAILVRDGKTTESKKLLSGSDVAGINFISRHAVSTHATTGNESFCTCLGKESCEDENTVTLQRLPCLFTLCLIVEILKDITFH